MLELVVIVLLVGLFVEWAFWRRSRKRLPEEFGRPLLAEETQFRGGRMSLYDDFLVTSTTYKLRVIPYTSIQRVGIARQPFFRRRAHICINYTDDQGVVRLAQFPIGEGDEFLRVLAERLDVAGKGGLVNWPHTQALEGRVGVKTD